MSNLTYLCPQCRSTMAAVKKDDFDTWECTGGHGVGFTVTEAHGRLQEDEIRAIWQAAKSAPQSSLKSPILGRPMVAVTIVVDDDEIEGNEGPGARPVTLDVCPDEQFLWFQVVALESMSRDLPNPPAPPEELARIHQIRGEIREAQSLEAENGEGSVDDIGYRFGSRVAALLGMSGLLRRLGDSTRERVRKG